MHFPTWVDLKGEDAVPETVHHVVVPIDPRKDHSWTKLQRHIQTDQVHAADSVRPGSNTPGELLFDLHYTFDAKLCKIGIRFAFFLFNMSFSFVTLVFVRDAVGSRQDP